MPDPTLRQLLEFSRPVREFSQAIQTAFRLVEAAVTAEGQVENLKARATAATKDVQELEARKSRLADEVAAERERLLVPTRQELVKVEGDLQSLRQVAAADKQAFDDERGRRTSILRTLEEQATTAQRDHGERLRGFQNDVESEKARLRGEIEELKARAGIAREDLERTRTEYNQVLEAASKLVRRAG